MDRFLVKPDQGDLRGEREEPAPSGGASGDQPSPNWRHLRGQGLDCDYTVLFGKAEADEIFRELEQQVEYFTGTKMVVTTSGSTGTMNESWPPGVPSRLSPSGLAETSSSDTETLEGRGPGRQWR